MICGKQEASKEPFFSPIHAGEMAEWLKAHAWKACLGETLTWVRIPLSPPYSLNCREIPPFFPPKYAKYAHLSRLFLSKPDRRERTAQLSTGPLSRLFSAGQMRSPVSSRDMANAMRSEAGDSAIAS